ncbi:MAG TPA: protein kinase [Kofleriaceae bacterium]|nr:protein kinase [Kofleriaceae bacterium]
MPPPPDRTETLAPRPAARADLANDATEAAPVRNAESLRSSGRVDDPERYEQVAEHARGGLGRVVRAVDKRLGRTVAVKELLRHDASNEARFLREAMITARLEHPGIVPVHEAGRWPNGDPYYVMKLVEGRTLKELIVERKTLRERLALLPHVIAIADAVGYAHSEGVIHRDLKPSNVIVGEFGETVVVDWGLARDRKRNLPEPPLEEILYGAGAGASTVSGKVVGTPAYMSPEQARGELVDERADVYAIGTVLYELLAGIPPHHDDTPQGTLERVIAGPPRPLTSVVPHLPSELATIVGKAMARLPDDRYANASLLAEDLRRFHTGKLVSAHSYTVWSLLRKKLAQHRGVVAVAVASVIALGTIGVGSFRRVVAERNIAQSERERAFASQVQSERRQRELVLLQAATSLRKDPTATLAWLKDYQIADEDRARVLDLIDEATSLGVARHVFRPGDWVWDAVITPDGQTVVTYVRDGTVLAYDLRTGAARKLGRARAMPTAIAMSPDGRYVATTDRTGEVVVWPLDGAPPRVLVEGARVVSRKAESKIKLSPDGERVLVLREDEAPVVYRLAGGAPAPIGPAAAGWIAVADRDWSRQVVGEALDEVVVLEGAARRPLAKTAKPIRRLVMSPRGDTVLIHDGEAIWLVPFAGGPLRRLADLDGELAQAVWSPDEGTIALGAKGGKILDVRLVDVATGAVRDLRGHTDANYSIEWSRDGRRLLTASDDTTARVWTVADGSSIVLRGHDDDVFRARFSLDERLVVTASFDGSVRVWPVDQPGSRAYVEGEPIGGLKLDGERALVATPRGVAWWNVASGRRLPLFSWAEERGVGAAVPSPDGAHLFVLDAEGAGELRHRDRPPVALRGHRGPILHVQFSPDSKHLFTSSRDRTLRRWDVATGEGEVLFQAAATPIRMFAVAADGRVAFADGDAMRLIAPDGSIRVLGTGPRWIAGAVFAHARDKELLLLRRNDGSVALVDGDRLIELPNDLHSTMPITVSADGTRIAAAVGDRTVRVWEAATGRVLGVLRGHSDLVLDVAFSPDGRLVASASYDNTVRIWQPGTGRYRVLRGHTASVNQIEWDRPDQLVTGSTDGTLRVWDVPSLELPAAADLADRLARATTARIDVDDRPTTGAPRPRGI